MRNHKPFDAPAATPSLHALLKGIEGDWVHWYMSEKGYGLNQSSYDDEEESSFHKGKGHAHGKFGKPPKGPKGQGLAKRDPEKDKREAKNKIKGMAASLKKWLADRTFNDEIASGVRKADVDPVAFKEQLIKERDWKLEQKIGLQLHALLSEIMDPSQLPDPDITKDPNAAVTLAKIAIAGKMPDEPVAPQAQGAFAFSWPVVAVVGLVAFTIMIKIRSDANVAIEKEREISRRAGVKDGMSFWTKAGIAGALAWIAWEKLGVKKHFKK